LLSQSRIQHHERLKFIMDRQIHKQVHMDLSCMSTSSDQNRMLFGL
jgi:hypothetical protein